MNPKIITYYNELAESYDGNRFANSYGAYIHQQEIKVVGQYLDKHSTEKNVDIACGTGRFLPYADFGVDISPNMIEVSSEKFPSKFLKVAGADQLPFEEACFRNALSFHLLMHLKPEDLKPIFSEVHRVLEKGGLFIFDIPSQKRRKLTNYKAKNWHGGNQITKAKIEELTSPFWNLKAYHGISFFPIHRIPSGLRKYFIKVDNFLGQSVFREYASHLIFILEKK